MWGTYVDVGTEGSGPSPLSFYCTERDVHLWGPQLFPRQPQTIKYQVPRSPVS